MADRPTIVDVLEANTVIRHYLSPTPFFHYPSLDKIVDAQIWIKHENHQPIGVFKVRGGINLISRLTEEERKAGVVTASTGNHGQSIAYAARIFNTRAMVGMPKGANPVKVAAIQNLGAEILFHGKDFDESRDYIEELAKEKGYRYIHAGNEPLLIAGVGTYTLEIIKEKPDIEVIIVPIGGGSGAAGACIVAKAINPGISVIGVQSENAPAAYLSWEKKALIESTTNTVIDGLATRTPFHLPQSILWELLDDFILVSDTEILQAVALMVEKTHNVAEGAGAAPLAAALKLKDHLRGKRTALILSGGNTSLDQLKEAIHLYQSNSRVR